MRVWCGLVCGLCSGFTLAGGLPAIIFALFSSQLIGFDPFPSACRRYPDMVPIGLQFHTRGCVTRKDILVTFLIPFSRPFQFIFYLR